MVHHRQRQLRNILKRRSELCKMGIDEYVWVQKSAFYVSDGISFLNLRFENDVKMYGTQTGTYPTFAESKFENDVKMYGTQTNYSPCRNAVLFENDVKMYGTQTELRKKYNYGKFENDVKMYGTQTYCISQHPAHGLRMM